MKHIAILCAFLLLCTEHLPAQNRQAYLTSGKDNIVIYDSRADTAGNIIHVGLEWQQGASYSTYQPIAIKTSINGTRIWTRRLSYTGAMALKVRIAANGDYLVLCKDNWPMLWRLNSAGGHVFARRYTYSNQVADYITGFCELPNKHIAICGFNDFTYSSGTKIYKGFYVHTDSAGQVVNPPGNFGIKLQTYGNDHSSPNTNDLFLNDVACLGNRLYFVGSYQPTVGSARGLVIRTDLDGNSPTYYITGQTLSYGSATATAGALSSIINVGGKLYVSTFFNSSSTQHQVIGLLDTASFSISGIALHVAGKVPYHAQYLIRDSSNWFFAFQPSLSQSAYEIRRTIFSGKITNGAVVKSRRIFQDSNTAFFGLAVVGDTAMHSGTLTRSGYGAGFLASYDISAAAASLCNVTDTVVQSNTCSISMSLLSGVPTSVRNLNSNGIVAAGSTSCVYDMHLCGNVPCGSSGLSISLAAVPSASVCPGDTVRLVRSASCNRITWYKDNVAIPDQDTLVIPTDTGNRELGRYFVVVDNGACRDTSGTTRVLVYPEPPVPQITQVADSLFSSAGNAYQWLDSNGQVIMGATGASLYPPDSARYAVRVADSNGCSAVSAFFYYARPAVATSVAMVHGLSLRVYPNPVRSDFVILSATAEPLDLALWDNTGRCIRQWRQASARQQYDVVPMNLAPGLYTLSASGREGISRYKLVIVGGQ